MKRQSTFPIFAFIIAAFFSASANAQFGDLVNQAKTKVE